MSAVTSLNNYGNGCTRSVYDYHCGRASPTATISLISSLLTSPHVLVVFYRCFDFNRDLSRWDVSSVTNMNGGAVALCPLL